jgi:hypothetical protein
MLSPVTAEGCGDDVCDRADFGRSLTDVVGDSLARLAPVAAFRAVVS